MVVNKNFNLIKLLTIIYFINSVIEVVAESFSFKLVIFITKPLIPLLLMLLYFYSSLKPSKLFYLLMFFSVLTNLLFIPNTSKYLFYGVICYTIHRVFLLIVIFKAVKIKDYIPLLLATVPLLFVFFYLFAASDVPENSYYLIISHNVMAAILGGVAISNYIMNDTKQNSLLLISVLLFLGLQLVVYIERYYMVDWHTLYLRPLAMILNVLAFFSFYKFILLSERLNNN